MDQVLILEEQDTDAAIAFLLEGAGAPAMLLIVSWGTFEDALTGMDNISRCGIWVIEGRDAELTITGYGQTIVFGDQEAEAIFWCTWNMEDPYVVSFFVQHSRTQGFFILLPAVNGEITGTLPPVACYLA